MRFICLTATTALTVALTSCTDFATSTDPEAPASLFSGKGHSPVPSEGTYPIDLETTLKLAAGRNLDLAIAIEKSNAAAARSDRAVLSLIPDLAVGASFAKQNGLLQDTLGTPVNTKRVSDSSGLGTASGVPGLSLDLPLSRAIFSPLAARQDRAAAVAAAQAQEHQIFADAAAAYYELVRARSSLQLARELEGAAGQLADSTKAFAAAGEGLDADAERAMATHLLRKGHTARAEANLIRRSSALARILHLPPSLTLVPTDKSVAATELVDPDEPVARMVATALKFRPESAQMLAEVAAAGNRLTEQKVKPFLPNVSAGYSNYEFGAGQGSSVSRRDDRDEVTAMIYWKLEGLGFGNAAAAREQQAELKLTRLKEARTLDNIANEVAAARAETYAQRARIPIGRQAAGHAKKSYELTTARLQEAQGLPIEALASIQTLAEAKQAEVDSVIDYNIAQHRLLAALGHPYR
ncbi:TolC family protein [Haloferula chungangensis]|uniref:TolC family protein n=1 Tax=Haloferula chungangensis TaxID=1048331 RepID=A0ABW2LAF4_9BACT